MDNGQGIKKGVKSAFGSVTSMFSLLVRTLPKRVLGVISAVIGTFEVGKGVADVFKQSKANAKLAGALLGCTLALREPFHA